MKSFKNIYSLLAVTLVLATACETEDDLRQDIIDGTVDPFNPPPVVSDPGSADFSKYVSIGASITAGFMDGALYTVGQDNSYPNLLAAQFATAGGGTFAQPDIGSNVGFNSLLNPLDSAFTSAANGGRFKLDTSIPAPVPVVPGDPMSMFAGAVQNFAIPGMRLVDATVNGYGNFNPYYGRFASSATSSILEEALAAAPSFYTMWLGGNDILGYASSGGTTSAANNPAPPALVPGISDYYITRAPANTNSTTTTELMDPTGITNEAVFRQAYTGVLGALAAGSDGVVINVPDLTLTPVFNLITPDLLAVPFDLSEVLPDEVSAGLGLPSGSTFADALNALYAQYGFAQDPATGLPTRQIFNNSATNSLAIETFDESGNRIFRQVASTDKILLSIPQDSLAAGWGSVKGLVLDADGNIDLVNTDLTALQPFPIPSRYILDGVELAAIQGKVTAYNDIIDEVASGLGVSVVDANALVLQAAIDGGIEVNEQFLNYDFSPNGFFSVDGLHPNSRGQAIMANEVIEVINNTFSSTLPDVNVLVLPGITVN